MYIYLSLLVSTYFEVPANISELVARRRMDSAVRVQKVFMEVHAKILIHASMNRV